MAHGPGPVERATEGGTAFEVVAPDASALATPLVFASPHSGRLYPSDMGASLSLTGKAIRGSEDAFVDALLEQAPAHGATVIRACYARAYVDVNREAYELDPEMFVDALPAHAVSRTARIAAGLGSIAKVVAGGQRIYDRKLTFAEADARICAVHQPYHAELRRLVEAARLRHGFAVLVDWHSMPSAAVAAVGRTGKSADIVLGDRFGASCSGALTARVERELERLGLGVVRNAPYAGGYTTEAYGRPAEHVHALQIEMNRGLYLDEAAARPSDGFAALAKALGELFQRLSEFDWAAMGLAC